MKKRQRLTRSADFQKVYRQGKSVSGRYLVLYYFNRTAGSGAGEPRLGVSVSKKVGGAVQRNRVKRVLKESFGHLSSSLATSFDYVIIARPGLAEYIEKSQFEEVTAALAELFRRAGLIQKADLLEAHTNLTNR